MKPKCPCRGCEMKGCGAHHDKCDAYQAWKKKLEHTADERQKESDRYSNPDRPRRLKNMLMRIK